MTVKGSLENGVYSLALVSRIDSGNAVETEAAIGDLLTGYEGRDLIVDAEKLEYISSAGLRVLLRLRKRCPGMRIVNVSLEVYEILEMTGFTEMLSVEKAYRRLSVEGCEVIGEGANGKVYRTDPETIVKVYRNPDSLEDIKHEREVARKAFILGVPTAISYDVVRVGNSYASVFELLDADSLAKLIREHPENIDEYIRVYVELLRTIHGTVVPRGELPSQKQTGLGWVRKLKGRIPEDQYEKIWSLMEAIPENDHMLHGDYHIKNVMMQGGEALLIDMDTLAVGDPVFEFAAMYMGYMGFSELDRTAVERFMGITWEQAQHIWKQALRLYLDTDDEAVLQAAEDKARLTCYIRLTRRTMEKDAANTAFIRHCMARLTELLPRVDSLAL